MAGSVQDALPFSRAARLVIAGCVLPYQLEAIGGSRLTFDHGWIVGEVRSTDGHVDGLVTALGTCARLIAAE